MRNSIIILGVIILVAVGYLVIQSLQDNQTTPLPPDQQSTPTPSQQASCNPQFSDYPIQGEVYSGAIAEVNFETYPEARTYRTAIREGAAEGVDIAGTYAIASWGCGTNCQGHAFVNVVDGTILQIPLVSYFDIQSDPASTLLIVNPQKNIPQEASLYSEVKTEYYTLENEKLSLICEKEQAPQTSQTPIPFYSPQPGETWGSGENCIQVVVTAEQEGTGEIRQFPTPCHVPDGWTIIDR